MSCPECKKKMGWVGDDHNSNEESYSLFECRNCNIDLFKYWKVKEANN